MQKIFNEVNSLDQKCYERFHLSEDLLMEHAASGMQEFIENNFDETNRILIVCGSGNNGADGVTLARLLHGKYDVDVFMHKQPKSKLPKVQIKRAKSIGVPFVEYFGNNYDIVVDCLFGSGLNRSISEEYQDIITLLNNIKAYKIACDIPSGVESDGHVSSIAFKANTTLTMGALKKSLFLDMAKDYVGDIKVINLGVNRSKYEGKTNTYLLDIEDLDLPNRNQKDTHKGRFGHLAILSGEKEGASILSAMAGFHMGSGLVSLVGHQKVACEPYLMQSHFIPENATAIALGMGLGKYERQEILDIFANKIPKVIDADLFYSEDILNVLDEYNIVLTPHPKEFCSLLKICDIADVTIEELQKRRFHYIELFCEKYPKMVLLLKGANVIIGHGENIYVNPHGSNCLSFGGSGDVLAGFIASLLSQGYDTLYATIQGSLIHVESAKSCDKNNYSLTPIDLIDGVCYL